MGGPVSRLALVAMAAGLLAVAGCGGGGSSNAVNNSGGGGGGGGATANSQAISVNFGPTGNYVNGIFTNVTVCVPGTATCQTIPVLVDTGSSGLRLLASGTAGGQLTLTLPQENASTGSPLVECAQFADGFTWGPMKMADIQLAGETASSVPIQVIDTSTFNIPASCSNTGPAENTLSNLGTYGLLGVGVFRQDCGSGCTAPGFHAYFSCASASTCTEVGATLMQQAQNLVWMFSSSDNNGVVIELPHVAATGAATAAGTLTFGIGTQSNNALGSATVMTTAPDGTLSTTFGSTTYTETFIDSGSNGYFLLTSGLTNLPLCPDGSGFYCPTATAPFSATNHGANGASSVVNFSVANEQTLFSTNNAALNDLGGDNSPPPAFDWGLPFFFGRTVFTGIEGQSSPGGTGPYLAY